MAKLQIPKKLRTEDFNSDQQGLVSKIAFVFNVFADEVYNVLNKNVDYDNLNRQLVNFSLTIDNSGNIINPPQVKVLLNGKIKGVNVINAINLINSSIYPSSAPYISWTINGEILSILNITGLQNNSQYSITAELIA